MANLPSAVLRQREKLQADLDAANVINTASNEETSEVVNLDTPPAIVPETPPIAIPPVVENPNARIQELEHLLRTRDGQTSTAMREANEARQRAEVMASQISALEESVGLLQRQKDDAEARAAAKAADLSLPNLDAPDDLTDAEKQTFGADSIGFVQKLTKKELLAYVKPLIDKVRALESQVGRISELDKLPQLEKSLKNNETEAQRLREEEFFRKEVLEFFPDFVNIRNTQEWKDYLSEDIPGKGIKNADLLNQYRFVNNAKGIRSLIQSHYDTLKSKPNLASIATPRGAQTEGLPVVKPRMKASEYQQKLKQRVAKRLPDAEWQKFKSEFDMAMKENRVDMDARL